MNKNLQVKSKKGMVKGTALAFAAVMSVACFPAFSVNYETSYAEASVDNTIYLLNAGDGTANVGGTYTIRTATFGNNPNSGTAVTDVKVTYLSTGETVPVEDGAFEVTNVGTYNICYTYVNAGKTYTLDYEVTATRSNATVSFDSNLDAVLPNVYDLNYAGAKSGDNYKAVNLPLPTVYDESEEKIENVAFYTKAESERTANDYVVVSVRSPKGNDIGLTHEGNNISIPGSVFGASDVEIGEYTITYAYYAKQVGASKDQCIKSVEKTFTVKKGYYVDYELKANVGSMPTFVTGVETEIPSATATASFKNSVGASTTEQVNVKYTAKILYKNGSDYEEVPNAVVDGKFTPAKDGEYRIVYTVEDFYGNKKESQARTFKVEDTKAPEVFMYDASDVSNYVDGDLSKGIKEYVEASSKLKTKTGKDNVVIYAIGAKDNASALDKISLNRKIRNSNSATIDVSEYNAYNLIFNYKYSNLDAADLLGRAIAGKSETEADTWLKNNKFLKVINTLDAVKTALNDTTITTEQIESKKDELVAAGYAYVSATHEITTGTYTIRYSAVDESKNETSSDSYTMTIESANVVSGGAPKVTTTTKFADSYTSKEVIEFAEPVATDEIDSRMDVVTTYRFLKGDKTTTVGEVVTVKDKFKIDLSKAPEGATYVEIKAEATNDFGETGRFVKVVAIADINDTVVPTVVSNVEPELGTSFKQNEEIDLPITVYEDDYVAVMTAKVRVFLLDADGKRKEEISTLPGSSDYSTWGGVNRFTYNAGKVVPPFAGRYEVMVQAQDPANNIVSTYYYFTATSTEQDYLKLNVPSSINGNGKATVGDKVTLEIPSVTSRLTEGKKIYGVDEDGVAKFYSVSVNGPATPKKNTATTYTFEVAGKYTFKYTAKIAVYDANKLSVDENGVYYEASGIKYFPDNNSFETASIPEDIKAALREAKVQDLTSDEYVLEVSENSSAKTFEINYGSGENYSSSYKLDEEIVIYSAGAAGEIDTEKSIVSIVDPDNSTKEYKLSEFTSTIKYKFTKNGVYTINYKVVDKNGLEYAAKDGVKSFTIKVGDAEKPEVAFKENFLKDEYNLNEEFTLDISKIVLSDNGYGAGTEAADTEMRNSLLAKMKVVLTRVDDNGNTVEIENLLKDETNAYKFKLDNAGTYTLKVTVKDAVGLETTTTKTFEVSTEGKKAGVSTKTVGIILIVLACLVLAGVVAYFVISRIRMNKKGTKLVKKNKKDVKKD